MAGQNLLEKNFTILMRLRKGPATLDELASHARLPAGFLSIPLKVLQNQGLIQEEERSYRLSSDSEDARRVLDLIQPWLDYSDNTYFEIAKDVARLMHTKSWEEVGVRDILLFGSTLRQNSVPNDIDLLILHDGHKLKEFYDDPYGKNTTAAFETDQPIAKCNRRLWAYGMLANLGYKGGDRKANCYDWETEARLKEDSVINHVKARVADIIGGSNEALDKLFDIHALSTTLLAAPSGCQFPYAAQRRAEALNSCRDPTFWHTVLSEGRLYDMDKHDFTIKVDDKYAGATALFEQR